MCSGRASAGGPPAPRLVEVPAVVGVLLPERPRLQRRLALQYGATEGFMPLREQLAAQEVAIVNANGQSLLTASLIPAPSSRTSMTTLPISNRHPLQPSSG